MRRLGATPKMGDSNGMKQPAVFFDRDNTLIVSDGYLGDPAHVVLVDGAAQAVAAVRKLGFVTVVCSNQSGVARGMFDEEAVAAVNARMADLLRQADPQALIDHHEFCPFHPEATIEKYRADSNLRKPRPGMIVKAAEELNLDLSRSWMIGDAPRDVEAGKAAGCRTILFRDGRLAPSPAANQHSQVRPNFVVSSLLEAAVMIAANPAKSETLGESAAAEPMASTQKLEKLAEQILSELRHRKEQPATEFSVTKLLAGILQVIVLAALFFAYLSRGSVQELQTILLLAMTLQTMTIALMLMGQQR